MKQKEETERRGCPIRGYLDKSAEKITSREDSNLKKRIREKKEVKKKNKDRIEKYKKIEK
ncbi:hypothetical protein J4410_04115 [Candidatus Woesearchaeota archaeon]|nr:hypothetical protein [Candidatus Woesearchaeota archaeon]